MVSFISPLKTNYVKTKGRLSLPLYSATYELLSYFIGVVLTYRVTLSPPKMLPFHCCLIF